MSMALEVNCCRFRCQKVKAIVLLHDDATAFVDAAGKEPSNVLMSRPWHDADVRQWQHASVHAWDAWRTEYYHASDTHCK
jgi:hypothetical protein